MPYYDYQHSGEHGPDCKPVFELLQRMADEPLTTCPTCGQPVARLIATPTVMTNLMAPSRLNDLGFTQYKRTGKGEYEKTAGMGPGTIIDGES